MTESGPDPRLLQTRIDYLEELATRDTQTWRVLAEEHGVDQALPPWKTDLDGLCDALDDVACDKPGIATFAERRGEEDVLVAERYAGLPFPENQLVALAHSLIVRGIIDEKTLEARTREVKERLSS
ncbi:thiocyanate hydrolase [Mycobacterium sp. M1]|uniref:Thiocyanate hydrolase n=1 Tax=Mycolicibacter acidiphilus TaxID=2835306 RepID=A0ABS5RPA1_9MYCO|nr:thiocyanate hydrolase [Mycolicibacter acidiphilus]MBS9536107.1 thiocyanate hydrolase [Mycolicibacter acidiphilus]